MRPPYPPDAAPYRRPDGPRPLNWTLAQFGLFIFLLSATVLFGAALASYLIVRLRAGAPVLGTLSMPWGLWVSTVTLLGSAAAVHTALRSARRARWRAARLGVLTALALALAFVAVQTPSLAVLLGDHSGGLAAPGRLYGFVFVLVLIHAAHVVGGLAPLTYLAGFAAGGRLGPAQLGWLRGCAAYWHFLDAVWLILLAVFIMVG